MVASRVTELRAPPADEDAWVRGFGLALSEVHNRFAQPTLITEVMVHAGVSLDRLKAAGLSEYDLRVLSRAVTSSPPGRPRKRALASGRTTALVVALRRAGPRGRSLADLTLVAYGEASQENRHRARSLLAGMRRAGRVTTTLEGRWLLTGKGRRLARLGRPPQARAS